MTLLHAVPGTLHLRGQEALCEGSPPTGRESAAWRGTADSRDSKAMRRGAIDATEFAKRAEARREQRRIELDAVDKTRDADLAALRRSFRKRDEAAGVAVGSDSSSDSSGDSSAESSDEE